MNPKVIRDAYTRGAQPAEAIPGLRLQPVCAGHFVALEAIGSPLASGEGKPSLADTFAAAILLSVPASEARSLAADPAQVSARAGDLADATPPAQIRPLAEAISAHIAASFETVLKPKADKGEISAAATESDGSHD
jgi:hypothetical protein